MTTNLTRREILLGLAGAGLLAACGGAGDDNGGRAATSSSSASRSPSTSTAPSTTAAGSRELRRDAPRASGVSPVGAGAALHPFAMDLYRAMAGSSSDNVVLSPASVVFALALARNGARTTTAAEMDRVLRFDSLEAMNRSLNAVDQALAGRSGKRQAGFESTGELSLSLANGLWAEQTMTFLDPFLEALSASYGAAVHLVDYRSDPDGARRSINDWVAANTDDRIQDLIGEGVLSAATRLVLTNAIALSAPWDTPFDPKATTTGPFTTLGGPARQASFMHQTEQLAYAEGDGWQAVELPYVGRELAMTVVVPAAGRFEPVTAGLELGAVLGALRPRQVSVGLPRWTFRTQALLAEVLGAMGMPTAFTDRADFSAMTAEAELFISGVVHQAYIATDEKGTEAAAATAVVMRPSSAVVDPPVVLTADRPFLFVVRDVPTNTPLFVGRVVDPTAS